MTNGIIENPFDLNTKPWDEFNELIITLGPNVTPCKDNAGKYLKVRPDGSGTTWASGGGSGTDDYSELINKPKVNGVELNGNKSLDELGIVKKSYGSSEANKYLATDGNGDVILKTGVTTTVSFAEITGNPTDNTALSNALDNKVTKSSTSVTCSYGVDNQGRAYIEY